MSPPFKIGDRVEVFHEKPPVLKFGQILTITEDCVFEDGDWFVVASGVFWKTSRFRKVNDYRKLEPKTNDSAWIRVKDRMPPVDVVVDTKIDDERGCRNEQPLKRHQRTPEALSMWFLEDGSMYVYYTPTHWRLRK